MITIINVYIVFSILLNIGMVGIIQARTLTGFDTFDFAFTVVLNVILVSVGFIIGFII